MTAFFACLLFGLFIGYGIGRHRNPICWWDCLRLSLKTGKRVDGHIFVDDEQVIGCVVQTAKCGRCGTWHVGWWRA